MSENVAILPKWVDFHCHLDLYKDHAALIAECDRNAVATLAVTTTPKAWQRNRDMVASSRHVQVALGLHPQLVAERESELTLFHRHLAETRFVGEIGLDAGPRFYKSFDAQERVFVSILRACAEQGGKILTIHSVRSVAKILRHLESHLLPDRGYPILHWFTGTASEARRAAAQGCYFSINIEMLRSPKHRAIIAELPLERLLTETDGPFIEFDGRPVRPRDVVHVVSQLAQLRNVTAEEMARKIVTNLETLIPN